jgi:Glycosyl hydrolase family 30 beta sandwich domain
MSSWKNALGLFHSCRADFSCAVDNRLPWSIAPHHNGCDTTSGQRRLSSRKIEPFIQTIGCFDAPAPTSKNVVKESQTELDKQLLLVRIDPTANSQILNVAFQNPDGTLVLIAYNDTTAPQTFKVVGHGQSFAYSPGQHQRHLPVENRHNR